MSAVAARVAQAVSAPKPGTQPTRIALIGSGQVAQALALHVDRLQHCGLVPWLELRGIANARGQWRVPGGSWREALEEAAAWPRAASPSDPQPEIDADIDLVIDATASDAVADCHARWLEAGIAVVTANKRGLGESTLRAAAIERARRAGARYGDSATVGAGLGALRRLRQFQRLGEPVDEIAGVLSGTLAWLFDRFDGSRRLSTLAREAHARGYTEPDPREDVAARDVARKLRILARAAGLAVDSDRVTIDPRLACGQGPDPWRDIEALDGPLAGLLHERPGIEARLAVVARADRAGLRVGIEWLHPIDPLAARHGCDNAILIRSERYRERPLILRGPGAGPALTAAALLDDVLELAGPRTAEVEGAGAPGWAAATLSSGSDPVCTDRPPVRRCSRLDPG
jgi:homoserine dehydrogenase